MFNSLLNTIYITLVLSTCYWFTPYHHNVKIATKATPITTLECTEDELYLPVVKTDVYMFSTIGALAFPILFGGIVYFWIWAGYSLLILDYKF